MRSVLFAIIILVHFNLTAQVDPYLKLAAENNPGLKSKFNEYLAAMQRVPQVRSLPDPQVTFGLFIQPIETRVGSQRASLAVSQSFPWFGTLKAKGNTELLAAEAILKTFEDEKLRLFKEVRQSFDQLYLIDRSDQITRENLDLLNSFKELARINFESGKTGFVDVLRIEMEEQEMKSKLAYWKDTKKAELKRFENLLNTKLSMPISLPNSLTVLSLTSDRQVYYDSLVANNLRIRSVKHKIESKDSMLKVAKMERKPSFSVSASYINIGERNDVDISNNGNDAFLFPQIGSQIPINRNKYDAREKQFEFEKESLQMQLDQEVNKMTSDLEIFIRDHLDARRKLDLYEHLIELADRSLSLLQTEFTTGSADFEEVLRMEKRLLGYQLELEKAREECNRAIYNINYFIGK